MKKIYEMPSVEVIAFQSGEMITVSAQAAFGYFDDNDRQRTRE